MEGRLGSVGPKGSKGSLGSPGPPGPVSFSNGTVVVIKVSNSWHVYVFYIKLIIFVVTLLIIFAHTKERIKTLLNSVRFQIYL